jgi:hypothetical protein
MTNERPARWSLFVIGLSVAMLMPLLNTYLMKPLVLWTTGYSDGLTVTLIAIALSCFVIGFVVGGGAVLVSRWQNGCARS